MQRAARMLVAAILGAWALAVLVAGVDMLAVWISQLHGAGEPGDVYVAIWQRLAMLAIAGAVPPCLVWMMWRIGTRLAGAAHARLR